MSQSEQSTKKFLLDHVFYEMEMYFYTYLLLYKGMTTDQLVFNSIWNAHNVALRNLMVFFGISGTKGKDEIIYNSFSFAEAYPNRKSRQSYISPLSKAINHITVDRFLGYNDRMLDDIVTEAHRTLFPEIYKYTELFLAHLETDSNITYSFVHLGDVNVVDISEELRDNRVKNMIAVIKDLMLKCTSGSVLYQAPVTTE